MQPVFEINHDITKYNNLKNKLVNFVSSWKGTNLEDLIKDLLEDVNNTLAYKRENLNIDSDSKEDTMSYAEKVLEQREGGMIDQQAVVWIFLDNLLTDNYCLIHKGTRTIIVCSTDFKGYIAIGMRNSPDSGNRILNRDEAPTLTIEQVKKVENEQEKQEGETFSAAGKELYERIKHLITTKEKIHNYFM